MVIKNIIGYAVAGVGILGLAFSSVPQLKAMITIPATLTSIASPKNMIIASLIFIIVGVALAFTGSGKQKYEEVPIYEGKNIVGYRREEK